MKTFEQYKNPQINDWIIDDEGDIGYIKNMIDDSIMVKFTLLNFSGIILNKQIIHRGTQQEMEIIYNANKYNL